MSHRASVLAAVSVSIVAGLGLWGGSSDPEPGFRWVLVALFLPVLWGFLELCQGGRKRETIMDWHRYVIAVAGLLLALQLTPSLAIEAGLLDADWAPPLRRLSGIVGGLAIAVWGNFLPKLRSPWAAEEEWFDWQRVHRFAGWLAALTGVGVVVAWAALPPAMAAIASRSALITLAVLAVGRKFLSVADYSRRRPPRPPLRSVADAARAPRSNR